MNDEDVGQFQRLVQSPVRSAEREQALRSWDAYKLSRQRTYAMEQKASEAKAAGSSPKHMHSKGDYIRSLTAPAIDLREATFTDVCVGYVDLRGAQLDKVTFNLDKLSWTALKGAKLQAASLRDAQLPKARLRESDLRGADLTDANLIGADLTNANLAGAVLCGTHLTGANLEGANLVGANVEGCQLNGARVYGVAAWDLIGQPEASKDLIVTPYTLPTITADDIRVAQFLYLLLNNPEIRNVLDTVTRKVVLILGRFTITRKVVLDKLRDALREQNLVPVLYDFEQASDRDVTETITLLARMARFVIADLTEPSSIPHELQAVAPHVAVPIRLIVEEGNQPYSMSKDLGKYHWIIKPYRYSDLQTLLANLKTHIIDVAEAKRVEISKSRAALDW